MRHTEHNTQVACIRWFCAQHKDIRELLYAIPNGGRRNPREAVRLKMEGVRAGVPDLCLAIPRGGYGALYIELKSKTGRLSTLQKAWAEKAQEAGNKVVVCRGVEEFMEEVTNYLNR